MTVGYFAIAFATSLARGEQPGSFFCEQKAMRKHLIESRIHCVCRLPTMEGIKMIECSYCGIWYHIDLCVSVSADSQQPHTKWACVRCKSWTDN